MMGFFSQQYSRDDDYLVLCDPIICRFQDLISRHQQLVQYSSPIRLSEEDLRFSIPESMSTLYDIERAIEIQKEVINEAIHNGYFDSDEIDELFALVNYINEAEVLSNTVYEGIKIAA